MTDSFLLIVAPLHAVSGGGVPRLSLRRLGGHSLLAHAAQAALGAVSRREHVLVVTDDDEVALETERLGLAAMVVPAPDDPETWRHVAAGAAPDARTIVVARAAAPLIGAGDLRAAAAAGVAGVVQSTYADGRLSDAIIAGPPGALGAPAAPLVLDGERGLVVRSMHDWWIAERLFHRRRITFVVIGDPAVGLGHVYRAALLAHELADHDVTCVCPRDQVLAAEQLLAHGLRVQRAATDDLAGAVLATAPDLVINDILNTDRAYVEALRSGGARVVNFEDLGDGAACADLVINDIFLESAAPPNHRNGPAYFCIRDEFLSARPRPEGAPLEEVLITFGGTDPADSTARVARLVVPEAARRGIRVSIVTGAGYLHLERLRAQLAAGPHDHVELAAGTRRMSDYMARADVAFSSAGRTVFELAAMRVPAIILAANAREETHTFASEENGFIYLGRADRVDDDAVLAAWRRVADDPAVRLGMRTRMGQWDFRDGRARVMAELAPLLAGARQTEGE